MTVGRFRLSWLMVLATVVGIGCSGGTSNPDGGSSAGSGTNSGSGSGSNSTSGSGGTTGNGGALAGTWTATALTVVYGPANGTQTTISTGQTLDVAQSGNMVTYTYTNTDGSSGMCSGTVSGSTVTTTCNATMVGGSAGCTANYTRTDTVNSSASPPTMSTSYNYAAAGSSCAYMGYTFALSGTLTFGS